MTDPGWIEACPVDELVEGEGRKLDLDPPIALFSVGGQVYAIDDTCTHGQFSLSEGWVDEEGRVECIGHMAKFCVRDGRALELPATKDVASHQTRVESGIIYVRRGDQQDRGTESAG